MTFPHQQASARVRTNAITRRAILGAGLGFASLPSTPRLALAQTYPVRPVRLIVAAGAGSPPDINARIIGQWLSERLGRQFVIENRVGAGGNIGAEAAVRATADGYTLLLVSTVLAINQTLFAKVNFDLARDLAPIGSWSRELGVLVTHPTVPTEDLAKFIAYAKQNPNKLNMASGGNGTPAHVAGELFKLMSGVEMVHVPYRSAGPALTDLVGGQVQVMFATLSAAVEHIRGGRLRPLAVTAANRSPSFPEVPAISEILPGFEASSFFGLAAPAKYAT